MGRTYENRPLEGELTGSLLSSCLSDYNYGYLMDSRNPLFQRISAEIKSQNNETGYPSLCAFWELNGNQGISAYILNDISTNYYLGEFDPDGIYFPCDRKVQISGIDSYVTVKDLEGTVHVLSGGSVVSGQGLSGLSGEAVPDGTYQFYDFDSSNLYRYDERGFIFKVQNGKAKYVYRFENDYGQSAQDTGIQKYSQRVLYGFDDSTPGEEMQRYIDQCEEDGKQIPAVYFIGQGAGIPALDSNEVVAYMQSVNAYFAKVVSQSGNWAQDGTATRVFSAYLQEPRVRTKGKWTGSQPKNNIPCMYVFKMCSSCFVSKDDIVPDLKAWVDVSGMTGSQIVQKIKNLIK